MSPKGLEKRSQRVSKTPRYASKKTLLSTTHAGWWDEPHATRSLPNYVLGIQTTFQSCPNMRIPEYTDARADMH
eukprot:3620014-Pyramimonas_sp.AAC.1